jgi:hypothetical protein
MIVKDLFVLAFPDFPRRVRGSGRIFYLHHIGIPAVSDRVLHLLGGSTPRDRMLLHPQVRLFPRECKKGWAVPGIHRGKLA